MATSKSDQYLILDRVAGWRDAMRPGLFLTNPEGYLTLEPLPGTAALLLPLDRQTQEFSCPTALAPEACGGLLVVDADTHLIKRVHLTNGSVEQLPSVGGEGSQARRFYRPYGVAALRSGAFAVADTGNHRIQVFSPAPYALLQVWGARDPQGRPKAGTGPKEFCNPYALGADVCGTVYITDQGNRRIQVIAADGTWVGEFGEEVLKRPTRLALGPNRLVAVVDPGQQAVFLFPADRSQPSKLSKQTEPRLGDPRSVSFDPEGRLYVGDAIGFIHVLEPDPTAPGGYQYIDAGITGLDNAVIDLAWSQANRLLAIIRENDNGQIQRLWSIDPASACLIKGYLITKPLDSGIELMQWHRVALKALVPDRTSLGLETYTSEDPTVDVTQTGFTGWKPCKVSGGTEPEPCAVSGDPDPDWLVQSEPGRYLWLRLTFRSDGVNSPSLQWIKVFYPRLSYLQYLPSVFQEDEESRLFLDRFLSIFQTEFDDLDQRIDLIWQLFDPYSVDTKYLYWLAAWLALVINPEWPEAKLREMVKDAHETYRLRGTVAGLERAVQDYVGVPAKVLEHYRLRRWPALSVAAPLDGTMRLWSRNFYQRLQVTSFSQLGYFRLVGVPEPAVEPLDWGAHKFSVFFPVNPYHVEETQKQVGAVVEREKPAHTEATLCPVYPRFRVGIQATVGVDTVVGGISHLVLNHMATLGYDTILACSPAEQQMRTLGSPPRPRTGISVRLP
jgi:phage tail-like protein